MLLAEREGHAQEELDLFREFQEIENEETALNEEKESEARELALENLNIRRELALEDLSTFLNSTEKKNKDFRDLVEANEKLDAVQKAKKEKEFQTATDKKRKELFPHLS